MNNKKRGMLAVVLVFAMVFSAVAIIGTSDESVAATNEKTIDSQTSFENALDDLTAGDVLVLKTDVHTPSASPLDLDVSITIDGGSEKHTLTLLNNVRIQEDVTLTVKNCEVVDGSESAAVDYQFRIHEGADNDSKLVMENCVFTENTALTEDRAMLIRFGEAILKGTNLNGLKTTLDAGGTGKISYESCANVYLNLGGNAKFNTDVDDSGNVTVDSLTTFYAIKTATDLDLNGNTVVAENFFVKGPAAKLMNGTITADISVYEYNAVGGPTTATLTVEDVILKGDNKLDTGISITVSALKTFEIVGQLEINASASITNNGTLINNNEVPGSNALVASGNAQGDGWSFADGTLTLNGYDGSNYFFDDTLTTVVLIGENSITLDDVSVPAISSTALTSIKTLATGSGSLTIEMTGDAVKSAIVGSTTELTINGVSIDITISNTAAEDPEAVSFYAIGTTGTLTISFADISIEIDDTNNVSCGFKATTKMNVTKSTIDVIAPSKGIEAKEPSIIGSKVVIDAGSDALTFTVADPTNTNAQISNESVVDVTSKDGYGFTGSFDIAQGSTFTASSMLITGAVKNYATITNNGNMVIEDDKTFSNSSKFINNGVIGVYGKIENLGGELTNNGEINTYGYKADIPVSNVTVLKAHDDVGKSISVSDVVALADGTYTVNVSLDGGTTKIAGKMTYSSSKITINAINETTSVSISITLKSGVVDKYTVTVSPDFTVSEKTYRPENAGDTDPNLAALAGFKSLVSDDNTQLISVVGGKLVNDGSISIKTVQNYLVKGGELVNNGDLSTSKAITMDAGKLSGDAIVLGAGVTVTLTGDVDTSFTYAGTYTYDDPDKEDTKISVDYDNELKVVGDCVGVTFSTVKGVDDVNKATFDLTNNAAKENKKVAVTLVKGITTAAGTVFADGVTVEVLSGTTFQVKTSSTVDVGNGVLAAQDGSIINVKGDKVETYTFGTLTYTISFVKDGYTYYGSIAYALANATEGMTLVLSTEADIEEDLTVGKGITLQFAKGASLDVGSATKRITVVMLDGASFVFTDKNNDVAIEGNVTMSGTFTYDGNTVVFDKVPMVDTDAIGCTAAGKTTVSDIKVTLGTIKSGTVTAEAGKLALKANFSADDTAKTASKLVIAEGAKVSDINTTTDKVVLSAGSSAEINGTLILLNDATIGATVSGDGVIAMDDGKKATFNGTIAQNIAVTNKDATDKVVLKDLIANDEDAGTPTNYAVDITSVAKSGTKAAYMQVAGTYFSGEISAVGNVAINGLTVLEDAVFIVPKDSTVTVTSESNANGLVKVAGTLNMKVDGDASTVSYAVLKYEITYDDDGYTVYTIVGTAVKNASAGDSFTLTADLNVNGKQEIPSGVTIIVPEEYKIILGEGDYIILGSGITTLGATGGIQGTVELSGNAYVIVFADATMDNSKMKIVSGTVGKKIVDSQITALNQLYATAYALDGGAALGDYNAGVLENVVPKIEGFRFVEFTDAVGGNIPAKVGDGDVVAEMLASQVQVTFTKVEGISYYVNNGKMYTVGAPVYVDYGSTITAVADYGYTGNALVNGKAYITVDSTTKTITGSGVTPAVEPEKEDDGGMGITDYLLIVLVILAAILVVVVAIRMMRS